MYGYGNGFGKGQWDSYYPTPKEDRYHCGTLPILEPGIKLYKSFKIGSTGRMIANHLNLPEIESEKGFDLIVEQIKKHFASYLEAEPEVQGELALYQTQRENRQTFMEFTGKFQRKLLKCIVRCVR